MPPLKELLGKRSSLYREEITSSRISNFCKAIGAVESDVAPPTFMTVFRGGEFELFKVLNVELANILHAEQEYQYETPIHAGSTIRFETVLTQALEKQGSSVHLQFLTFETDFHTEDGSELRCIGKSKTMIVIRNSNPNGSK